jgi:periplasmic protein TonB
VNDAVNDQIERRQALDRGLSAGFLFSAAGHVSFAAAVFVVTALAPKPPLLQVAPGFVVPLPRGGGGTPQVEAPVAAAPAPEPVKPEPPAPRPEPPPRVVKPPKEVPKRGLPPLDARKSRATPAPAPPARPGPPERGTAAAAGRTNTTPGIEFGPAGPGVPGGSDTGDYYLAGVQRKIWTLWTQQIKTGFTRPVTVSFTILANGAVEDVRIVQSSGASLLDFAAQRAVLSAAPFHPLPKEYGTNRYTIQAIFRPTT